MKKTVRILLATLMLTVATPAILLPGTGQARAAAARLHIGYALPDTAEQANSESAEAVQHTVLKESLVQDAYSYLGIPYVWGGSAPTGFDCSGFVYYMYHKFGIQQVRTNTINLYTQGVAVDKTMLRQGDLVFFRIAGGQNVDHVGIYTGNGSFISAISSKGIYVQQLENPYWGPRYAGARRVY